MEIVAVIGNVGEAALSLIIYGTSPPSNKLERTRLLYASVYIGEALMAY